MVSRPTSPIQRQAVPLLTLGLAGSVAALLVFAWLAQQVAAGATIGFDAAVRDLVHRNASPWLTGLMRWMSNLGESASLLILGAGFVFALRGLHWNRAAVRFVVTMAGALLLDTTLKLAFHRTRPSAFFGTLVPQSYSFPSGHALFSVCFFGVAAALLTARIRNRAARAAIWAAAIMIALLIGLSRIYLGVHYPSDVVAGYAAAIVWVGTVAYADRLLLRRRAGRLRSTPHPSEKARAPEQPDRPSR